MSASQNTPSIDQKSKTKQRDNYTIVGGGKNYPVINCKACNEYPPLKSNLAISEELNRLSAYLQPSPEPACPEPSCSNHELGVITHPKQYQRFGKTKSGSSRYRCKACQKTFSVGSSTNRQKAPHKNKQVFKLLMNKTPFRRICEIADIGMGTLYWKIDFIHQQCMKFVGERERQLRNMRFDRLYLSTDRQDYMVNWTMRRDKRTVQLTSIGTAEKSSGYVLGMNLNFDPSMNPNEIEAEALELGEYDQQFPFRRYARLWLLGDYEKHLMDAPQKDRKEIATTLIAEITKTYGDANVRTEVEKTDDVDEEVKLPIKGMQTHLDYTAYGHYFLLRDLLQGAEKLRFFIDQDSALRAACLAAFQEQISARNADTFYVRINKNMLTGEKRRSTEQAKKRLQKAKLHYPNLSENQVKVEMVKEQFPRMREIGKWGD